MRSFLYYCKLIHDYNGKLYFYQLQAFMQRCILLANLDYVHTIVNNHCGELSAHYPSHLIVLENEKSHNQNDLPPSTHPSPPQPPPKKATETIYESINEGKKLEVLLNYYVLENFKYN